MKLPNSAREFLASLIIFHLIMMAGCSGSAHPTSSGGAPAEPPVPTAAAVPESSPNLALRLKVGDKFPLQKTVLTTLVQPSPTGEERSTAQKEFLLTVTVEAMPEKGDRAGHKQMGVKFHQVKFSRELNGKKFEYDSRLAKEPLPLTARPYQGLVGNQFSFWLGPDNQIEGVIDFDKFVERCLRGVPKERYEEVWNNLATQTGADGIANFVDDSIGLLPRSKVEVGESWTVTRRTQQPVPMVCRCLYKLQHLDESQAEVTILGDILPGAIMPSSIPGAVKNKIQMSIRGGKSTGSCTIDLLTGLPIHSQVEEFVDMHVTLANGEEFVQQKQTITTVRAFPASRSPIDETGSVAGDDAPPRLQNVPTKINRTSQVNGNSVRRN